MKNFKQFLKEYISNDIIYLRNYLSQSEEEKKQYLPQQFPWYIEDFLIENEIELDLEDAHEEFMDSEGNLQKGDNLSGWDLAQWLESEHPDIYKQYADYLYDRLQYAGLPDNQAEYPSWVYFDEPKLLKNQWLIHFTDEAESIAKEGFKFGMDDYEKLGLTKWLGDFDKKYGGYNFAYTVGDFKRYGYVSNGEYHYGSQAVVFRSSGIKTFHSGDGEPQVIFWGKMARDIVPIIKEYDNWIVYSSKTGKKIYQNEDLEVVVKWIIKNFDQYRKAILS